MFVPATALFCGLARHEARVPRLVPRSLVGDFPCHLGVAHGFGGRCPTSPLPTFMGGSAPWPTHHDLDRLCGRSVLGVMVALPLVALYARLWRAFTLLCVASVPLQGDFGGLRPTPFFSGYGYRFSV